MVNEDGDSAATAKRNLLSFGGHEDTGSKKKKIAVQEASPDTRVIRIQNFLNKDI